MLYYVIYLFAMGILLLLGASTTVWTVPQMDITIDFSKLLNYWDVWGVCFVLAVCLAALVCTRSLRPMGDAFAFMFTKRDYTVQRYEKCLLAVKTAVLSAFAGGGIMFIMSIINMLKSMNLDGGVSNIGREISLGLLSLVYALVIAFILLPVHIALKRGLIQKQETKNGQPVVVRPKNRKAG